MIFRRMTLVRMTIECKCLGLFINLLTRIVDHSIDCHPAEYHFVECHSVKCHYAILCYSDECVNKIYF
jgi:hypothetical protein